MDARQTDHEARVHGLPLDVLLRQALEHTADVAARARLAGRELDRAGLHDEQREAISTALTAAETLAAAAWQQLHDALGTVQRQQEAACPSV